MNAPSLRHAATYILPIRQNEPAAGNELPLYLGWLAERLEVIVVDGSAPAVFFENDVRWRDVQHLPQPMLHLQPAPELEVANGKVWGVLTGLGLASNERIIIGDDDVRYDDASLAAVLGLLDSYDVVRPQNYFEPRPWHALWDSGRTLLNRVSGGDWPGTLGVRRSVLQRTGGYRGDCLFENLELVRTVQAAGGSEYLAADVFVKRRPSTTAHFWSQRVRQAYDEFARPERLLFQLTWLPLQLTLLARRPLGLMALYAGITGLAELGRRRARGREVFPAIASFMAPGWVIERSICAWLALLSRVFRGGMTYRGGVIAKAASSPSELKARYAQEVAPT